MDGVDIVCHMIGGALCAVYPIRSELYRGCTVHQHNREKPTLSKWS